MEFNHKYNDVIKTALKATLHEKLDYIVFIDVNGVYGFTRGERDYFADLSNNVKLLGWTEYSIDNDIPKASFLEFDEPMTIDELKKKA